MAVDFGTTNSDRNYTTPDSPRLALPAGDWTWLTFFNPNDNVGFPYFLSYGGTYGAANSLQCFNSGASGWTVKVAGLTDQSWGGGVITIGSWMVGYATRRGGNLYAGAGLVGDTTTISESAGTAISSAYDPTGLLKIGIRSDLTSDPTYAARSIISDAIYLPGVGFTPTMLAEILKGQYLDRAGWWHKRRFHAYLPYAKEFLVDLTGRHALTRNGSGYIRGGTEKDSPFRRISEPTILTPLVTAAGGSTQTLTPSLYSDADTFYSATVSPSNTLAPPLYADADTFYAATVAASNPLTPSIYTDADTFYSATVAASNTLAPSLYVDTDTFYTPTVSGGSITLQPDTYTDADTFYTPTIVAGTVTLTPSLYVDADTFYSATVAANSTLAPSIYTDADTFYTPTVSGGSISLQPSLYTDVDTFYTPTVSGGAVTLTPSLYVDADTFYSSTAAAQNTLSPSLYIDADTFYSVTVSTGAVTLTPSLYVDTDIFYSATVANVGMVVPESNIFKIQGTRSKIILIQRSN